MPTPRFYQSVGDQLTAYDGNPITYDAWGNHVVNYTNGGGSITAIVNNPFRYRSYYYDTDLNLYYLGSRYYGPAIGRFINASLDVIFEKIKTRGTGQ